MKRPLAYVYVLLTILYLLFVGLHPVDHATIVHRHLTWSQAHIAAFSIAIPVVIIIWLAFYGTQKLYEYSLTIKKSQEGTAFGVLARGFQLLALYLPVRVTLKTGLGYLDSLHPSLMKFNNMVVIYVNILITLMAFLLIGWAARQLSVVAKARTSFWGLNCMVLLFSAVSVSYCYVSFMVKPAFAPTNWLVTPAYSLPLPVKIITVIIPRLFVWFIGFLAVYHIYLYHHYVKGVVYKQLFGSLSIGLSLVVILLVALQFLTTSAANVQHWRFSAVLVLAYLVLFAAGLAFVQVALGVRRLKLLDEV